MTGLTRQQQAAMALLARKRARYSFEHFNRAVCPEGEEPQKHHLISCRAVDSLIAGQNRQIMVFQPPGTAKTTYTTIRTPPYYLGRMYGKRKGIITASNTERLALTFGRRVRNLVNSDVYRAVFPTVQLAADAQAKGEWETADGGFYFACGVGQSIAGRRGDLGVLDDPNKNRKDADSVISQDDKWEWYIADFLTRLKPDTAQQLLIGTRWSELDIFGRLLPEEWQGESGIINCRDGRDWLVISLEGECTHPDDPLGRPMEGDDRWLWPEFFSPEWWEATKKTQLLIPRNWWSLYQQVPSAVEGNMFKRKKVQYYQRRDLPGRLNYYITGDYAVTEDQEADFSVIIVWGVASNGDIYVVDIWKGQDEVVGEDGESGWLGEVVDRINKYRPMYHGAETGHIRRVVEPMLKARFRERGNVATSLEWFSHSETDKTGDARAFLALYNAGRVYWPFQDENAEWVLKWLFKFPTGAIDDGPDACSQFGKLFEKVWIPAKEQEKKKAVVVESPTLRARDMMDPLPRPEDSLGGW